VNIFILEMRRKLEIVVLGVFNDPFANFQASGEADGQYPAGDRRWGYLERFFLHAQTDIAVNGHRAAWKKHYEQTNWLDYLKKA